MKTYKEYNIFHSQINNKIAFNILDIEYINLTMKFSILFY